MEEGDHEQMTTESSNSSSRLISRMQKPLDFVRNRKIVAVVSAIVVSCCLVLYLSSYNGDFSQFLGFNLSSSLYTLNTTSPDHHDSHLPADDPVHDKYYELRKALKAAATEDNTVILTTLNDAWAEPNNVFDLFLESFRIGDNISRLLNHLLVIAVDEKAYVRCRASVPHCYFFNSSHSNEMAHEARFMTPIYVEMMWERQAFLRTILTLGYNFVFTDTDIMWFRDPFPHFHADADFQTSSDDFNGNPFDMKNHPNNGFNFVRSNKRSIDFYNFWLSSRRRFKGMHEQNVFNKIKYDPYIKKIGLKYRFLDTDYFGGFCTPSKDFSKVCTMHANCCVGLDKKIADLKSILGDWKRYFNQPKNSTTPFNWTAPKKCNT